MKNTLKVIAFIAAFLTPVLTWAETPTMSVQEVYQSLSDPTFSATLIDVRTPDEYAEGHIEGSVNIPVSDIAGYLEDLRPMDKKGLVLYCRSGRRAAKAIGILKQAGFNNLTHMDGDMSGWLEAELPVVTAN